MARSFKFSTLQHIVNLLIHNYEKNEEYITKKADFNKTNTLKNAEKIRWICTAQDSSLQSSSVIITATSGLEEKRYKGLKSDVFAGE